MKLLKKLAIIIPGFFVATLVIYFFNLDMKLMTYVVEPFLQKIYDSRKRDYYV